MVHIHTHRKNIDTHKIKKISQFLTLYLPYNMTLGCFVFVVVVVGQNLGH